MDQKPKLEQRRLFGGTITIPTWDLFFFFETILLILSKVLFRQINFKKRIDTFFFISKITIKRFSESQKSADKQLNIN